MLDGIGELSTALLDGITAALSSVVDLILKGLEFLFVPNGNLGDDLKEKIAEKFPFVEQVSSLITGFLGLGGNAQAPKFEFTWYGSTVSIVNFEDFEDFLPFVHTIIAAIAWFTYLFRLYNRLPSIIGGFHT